MKRVTAFEAKTYFGELLVRVAGGEEVLITRYDKPVARMVPEGGPAPGKIRAAVDGLMRLQEQIARRADKGRRLSDREVRRAIEAGRL